jgi:hypothetical protein
MPSAMQHLQANNNDNDDDSMAITVETLVESYSCLTLPPITGQPTCQSITNVVCLLYANAASIHSKLDGSLYGYLAFTLSPMVYASLSSQPPPSSH